MRIPGRVSALDRKLLRDLWDMKGQSMAIAAVIAAGVAMFVMYLSNFDSLQRTRALFYERARFADVFASLKRAPSSLEARIAEMVKLARQVPGFRKMPIVFNEDDHFDFDQPQNNFTAAVGRYASWGYFDYRMKDEDFDEGYQSVPVNWGISSERKRGFFKLLSEITGALP